MGPVREIAIRPRRVGLGSAGASSLCEREPQVPERLVKVHDSLRIPRGFQADGSAGDSAWAITGALARGAVAPRERLDARRRLPHEPGWLGPCRDCIVSPPLSWRAW